MDDESDRFSVTNLNGPSLLGQFQSAIEDHGDADPPLTFAQVHEMVKAQYDKDESYDSEIQNSSDSGNENGSERGEEEDSESERQAYPIYMFCRCCGHLNRQFKESQEEIQIISSVDSMVAAMKDREQERRKEALRKRKTILKVLDANDSDAEHIAKLPADSQIKTAKMAVIKKRLQKYISKNNIRVDDDLQDVLN